MSDLVEAEPRPIVELMKRSQAGDREAFRELQRIGEASGISYTSGWSAEIVLCRLRDRASSTNCMARAGVEDDLAAAIRDLSDPRDGPIERIVVGRAALCLIDSRMADLEHLGAVEFHEDPRDTESLDRSRDRANRRLLATLKTLAEIRRITRPAVQVNQLSVGDGCANVVKL